MRGLLLLLLLAGCTDIRYGANFGFGPDGTSFSPTVSGSSGNARLTIGM